MVPGRRKAEGLPLLNPDKETSSTPRTPGGSSLRAAGLTCGALFWVVALGTGAALGFFLSHRVGWGVSDDAHSRAGSLDRNAAAEGRREGHGLGPSPPRPYESRPKGPQTETVCSDPPLLSNAGLVLPKCVSVETLLSELLDGVVLPFWLGPDGLGVDCVNGGFANLGLTQSTRGAGEGWKLRERFTLTHARVAAAFAKLHRIRANSISPVNATSGPGGSGPEEPALEMPWFFVHGDSHPQCLENGGALSIAAHAFRFVVDAAGDAENGGYAWSVSPNAELGGKFTPTRPEKRLEVIAAVLLASSEIVMAAYAESEIAKEAAAAADDAFLLLTSKFRAPTGGGYWPETFQEDWSVPDEGRHLYRTLSGHLGAMQATQAYVDSLVFRDADGARVAAAANALAGDVETVMHKAVRFSDTVDASDEEAAAGDVAAEGEADDDAYEEEDDASEVASNDATKNSNLLQKLATTTPGSGKDTSAAVALAASEIGLRVGKNGGASRHQKQKEILLPGGETTDDADANTFVVAREFYDENWNPVSAPTTRFHSGFGDGDPVTGVDQFDIRFGRQLELTWTVLEATRAVERAAAGVISISSSNAAYAESVKPPVVSVPVLASLNQYAWRFGLRDGGVVPGAGGSWAGVRDWQSDSVDDYSHQEHDKEDGGTWTAFESAVAALHEWELTGNRYGLGPFPNPGTLFADCPPVSTQTRYERLTLSFMHLRAARRQFSDSLSILYSYFVDWKTEPRAGQRDPAFLSAGLRSVISEQQKKAEQPSPEALATKRSPFQDPYRAIRALVEIQTVLRNGVQAVNAAR